MKPNTLVKLIERAENERDDEMAYANNARRQAEEAHNTLVRLQTFRQDFLGRAPGPLSSPVSVSTLQGRQHFTLAIGQAIGAQQQACDERDRQSQRAHVQLMERQKRLLALQSLYRRQTTAQQALQVRRDQKESDAWAARAAQLKPQGRDQ